MPVQGRHPLSLIEMCSSVTVGRVPLLKSRHSHLLWGWTTHAVRIFCEVVARNSPVCYFFVCWNLQKYKSVCQSGRLI